MKKLILLIGAVAALALILGFPVNDASAHAAKKQAKVTVSQTKQSPAVKLAKAKQPAVMERVELMRVTECPPKDYPRVSCLTHTVKRGQTFSRIATGSKKIYGEKVTVADLIAVNPSLPWYPLPKGYIRAENYVHTGEEIKLPFVRKSDLAIALYRKDLTRALTDIENAGAELSKKNDEVKLWKVIAVVLAAALIFTVGCIFIGSRLRRKEDNNVISDSTGGRRKRTHLNG